MDELIDFNLNKIFNSEDKYYFSITDFENPIGKRLHMRVRAEDFAIHLEKEDLIVVNGSFCSITRRGEEIQKKYGGWLSFISENTNFNNIEIKKDVKIKYQVFISSTYTDLLEERQAAVEAILKKGHIPAGMELFTAGDKSQWEIIKKWIDDSDIYFLLLGGRYGSIDNATGLSYTEMEYNYAIEKNKPFFALCLADEILDKKPVEIIKDFDLKNPKYIAFKEKITKKMCAFPQNIDQIKNEINHSLDNLISENKDKMKGWIKGN